jgi:Protein of unknown function (DUF3147)
MFGELLLRFILGGLSVSLFAVCGSAWQPKTFAGLFAAAPSIAVVSLALAFHGKGQAYAVNEARSMVLGAAALITYMSLCVVIAQQRAISVAVATVLAWFVWLIVALGLVAFLPSLLAASAS